MLLDLYIDSSLKCQKFCAQSNSKPFTDYSGAVAYCIVSLKDSSTFMVGVQNMRLQHTCNDQKINNCVNVDITEGSSSRETIRQIITIPICCQQMHLECVWIASRQIYWIHSMQLKTWVNWSLKWRMSILLRKLKSKVRNSTVTTITYLLQSQIRSLTCCTFVQVRRFRDLCE